MEFKGTNGKWRVDVLIDRKGIEVRDIVQMNGGVSVCKINRFGQMGFWFMSKSQNPQFFEHYF